MWEAMRAGDGGSDLRAGAVAHGIRLGKRPSAGDRLGFAVQALGMDSLEEAQHGDITNAEEITGKLWLHFTVTKEDIDTAIKLINDQAITYKEPKTSFMPLNSKELP